MAVITYRRLFASLFMLAGVICAQVNTGSISGVITDPSRAFVGAAKITLVNQATGVDTSQVSNSSGLFKAPFLQPGPYRVRVEAAGFKTYVANDVNVTLSSDVSLAVALALGAASDTVSVEAPLDCWRWTLRR